MSDIKGWMVGRLPDDWFEGDLEVTVDREEITVVGTIPAPEAPPAPEASDDAPTHDGATPTDSERRAAEAGRISRFRENTRAQRMRIADEAEHAFGRKVSWGAACGETRALFTHLAVPVMTRLRQSERQVLDTLVEAGVARSRSDALGWAVRLVGQHEAEWIGQLQDALVAVRRAREAGPSA